MNISQKAGAGKKNPLRHSPQNMGAIQDALTSALMGSSEDSVTDEKVIKAMARIISDMGVNAAVPAEPAVVEEKIVVPSLTKYEMDVITLFSNPNRWFIVNTTKNKPHINKFAGLGGGFEVTYRTFKGECNTFARYNGGEINDTGKEILAKAQEKLEQIKAAATTHGAKVGKKSVAAQSEGSLAHAVKYPLSSEEQLFLAMLDEPNTLVVLSESTKRPESWHAFRWKWQNRYGFDLSQITITQRKLANDSFTVLGKYTPNSDGSMNDGLRRLVEFLNQKPKSTEVDGAKTPSKKGVLGSILGTSR